jgi:hypothetical protein
MSAYCNPILIGRVGLERSRVNELHLGVAVSNSAATTHVVTLLFEDAPIDPSSRNTISTSQEKTPQAPYVSATETHQPHTKRKSPESSTTSSPLLPSSLHSSLSICPLYPPLHDYTPARLIAPAAIARLAASHGLGLDDGGDGGGSAGRHCGGGVADVWWVLIAECGGWGSVSWAGCTRRDEMNGVRRRKRRKRRREAYKIAAD